MTPHMSPDRISSDPENHLLKRFFLQNLARCHSLFLLERWTLEQWASSKELKRKKWDWGTTSHLVVNHNQRLAWTIFGHWSLQHHAGPTVLLSQHCNLGRDRMWLKLWIWCGSFELLIIFWCVCYFQVLLSRFHLFGNWLQLAWWLIFERGVYVRVKDAEKNKLNK